MYEGNKKEEESRKGQGIRRIRKDKKRVKDGEKCDFEGNFLKLDSRFLQLISVNPKGHDLCF